MRKIKTFLLTFLVAGSLACGDGQSDREIWESKNISSYHMIQSVSCFCINDGPYFVVIKDDTLFSAVNNFTNEPVDAENLNLYTVDALFDLIDQARSQHADVLKVHWDDVFHYPKKIDIDFSRQAVDDELTIVISGFGVDP